MMERVSKIDIFALYKTLYGRPHAP